LKLERGKEADTQHTCDMTREQFIKRLNKACETKLLKDCQFYITIETNKDIHMADALAKEFTKSWGHRAHFCFKGNKHGGLGFFTTKPTKQHGSNMLRKHFNMKQIFIDAKFFGDEEEFRIQLARARRVPKGYDITKGQKWDITAKRFTKNNMENNDDLFMSLIVNLYAAREFLKTRCHWL